jgi:hypothetical protein
VERQDRHVCRCTRVVWPLLAYRSIEAVCMRRSFRRIAGLEQRSGSRFARVQPTGRSISESTRGNERRQSSRADRSHLASDDRDPTLHSRMHSYGFRTRNSDGREVKSQDPLEMHPHFHSSYSGASASAFQLSLVPKSPPNLPPFQPTEMTAFRVALSASRRRRRVCLRRRLKQPTVENL